MERVGDELPIDEFLMLEAANNDSDEEAVSDGPIASEMNDAASEGEEAESINCYGRV